MPNQLPVFLTSIQAVIADDMRAVEAVIRQHLNSEVALINQVEEHIFNSGGKRLRPALVLLAGGAVGSVTPRHHRLAAVVEIIHTATLLHDDVVDGSAMRRGKATANTLFGNATSVLVGDFLYSRAFQMMVTLCDLRLMEVLADATNIIAEGEVLQLLSCHDPDISEAACLRIIQYKTAKLFEVAARLGAMAAGGHGEAMALAEYGMRLGTAFQLIDDVLDLSSESGEIGKNMGDDLAEGKPTMPMLYALRHGTPRQQDIIRRAIKQGGLDELDAVVAAIRETGACDYVRKLACCEAEIATRALTQLPDTKYRQVLLELAGFAVDRLF